MDAACGSRGGKVFASLACSTVELTADVREQAESPWRDSHMIALMRGGQLANITAQNQADGHGTPEAFTLPVPPC